MLSLVAVISQETREQLIVLASDLIVSSPFGKPRRQLSFRTSHSKVFTRQGGFTLLSHETLLQLYYNKGEGRHWSRLSIQSPSMESQSSDILLSTLPLPPTFFTPSMCLSLRNSLVEIAFVRMSAIMSSVQQYLILARLWSTKCLM